MKKILFAACINITGLLLHAQQQGLDPGFGNKGTVITRFAETNTYRHEGEQIEEQSGGRVLVFFSLGIARHFADGRQDSSFGVHGFSSPIALNNSKNLLKTLVLPDDRFIQTMAVNDTPYLVGYRENGFIDERFGNGGVQKLGIQAIPAAQALRSDHKVLLVTKKTVGSLFELWSVLIGPNGKVHENGGTKAYQLLYRGNVDVTIQSTLALPGNKVLLSGSFVENSVEKGMVFRLNEQGMLDPAFGTGGYTVFEQLPAIYSLAMQPGGRILALAYTGRGMLDKRVLIRLNSNGERDPSFGNNGISELFPNSRPFAIVVQHDGKILACDTAGFETRVVRYNADASVDPSYGNGGVIYFRAPRSVYPRHILLMKNGDLALTGTQIPQSSLSRYFFFTINPAGTATTLFGLGGSNNDNFKSGIGRFEGIAVQTNGNILAVGTTYAHLSGRSSDQNIYLTAMRLLPNGTPDPSFGIGGKTLHQTGYTGLNIMEVFFAQRPDNGYYATTISKIFAFNANGEPDGSFAANGVLETEMAIRSMVLLNNGKLLLASASDKFMGGYFVLSRYLQNGNPDPSFGINGKIFTNYPLDPKDKVELKVYPDGRILIFAQNKLARLSANGNLDATFGNGGYIDFNPGWIKFDVTAMAIDAQNRIVCAGATTWMGKTGIMATRLHNNGTPDYSFGNEGMQWVSVERLSQHNGVRILQNGDLLFTGSVYGGYSWNFRVVRLNSSGFPVQNFGTGGVLTATIPMTDEYPFDLAIGGDHAYIAGQSSHAANTVEGGYWINYSMVAALRLDPGKSRLVLSGKQPMPPQLQQPLATVYPNPSASDFALQIWGAEKMNITLMITDAAGRVVYSRNNIAPNTTLRIGHNLVAGVYLAEIICGTQKQTLKLVKQ